MMRALAITAVISLMVAWDFVWIGIIIQRDKEDKYMLLSIVTMIAPQVFLIGWWFGI